MVLAPWQDCKNQFGAPVKRETESDATDIFMGLCALVTKFDRIEHKTFSFHPLLPEHTAWSSPRALRQLVEGDSSARWKCVPVEVTKGRGSDAGLVSRMGGRFHLSSMPTHVPFPQTGGNCPNISRSLNIDGQQ